MMPYCTCGHAERSHKRKGPIRVCTVKSCQRCLGFAPKGLRLSPELVPIEAVFYVSRSDAKEYGEAISRMGQKNRDTILRAMQREKN